MLDEFLHTLEHGPQHWAYALIAVAAAIEYVFPPLPGDTVVLFAVVLSARAQLHWAWVYGLMTLGAVLGGLVAWRFGVWLSAHEEQWPGFLRQPSATRALDAVRRGYERHGSTYLLVNRFLPALRAFFFVGAGLSGMRAGPVIVYGGISAAAWNALLLALGYAVGHNWDTMRSVVERYATATIIVIGIAVVVLLVRRSRGAGGGAV
ncbi:MAG: VTT domain-containing protein [Myxococcota bacterium]